ncbi:metalloregulator ArsR/SmtB family transcription factor [Peribacillus sp. SCS-155]|uniref:DUF2087 domain-containing protein n=1 Tax=Peribacillus sedimenti TaxID=3115297 RepID=UPI003905E0AC
MQLDKLVSFHKTMGDPTRIRILSLLASGPKHGQALAGILSLTPPTISHHLAKLKESNLVYDRRDKNTIYYHLNLKVVEHFSQALPNMLIGQEEDKMTDALELEYQKILQNFLTKDGRLKTIPAQRRKKMIVLYHLANRLDAGRKYPEKELNEYIKKFHEDYATIRREFIIMGIMYRDKGIYELNPKEMWEKI